MVQLDGAGTSQTARVVIVGATNRYNIHYFSTIRCDLLACYQNSRLSCNYSFKYNVLIVLLSNHCHSHSHQARRVGRGRAASLCEAHLHPSS